MLYADPQGGGQGGGDGVTTQGSQPSAQHCTWHPDPIDISGFLNNVQYISSHATDIASQAISQFHSILSTPGGAGCLANLGMAGATGGAAAGAEVGLAGVAGGPSVTVTEGAGIGIGAVAGSASGLVLGLTICPGGAGNGGGGVGAKKITFGHGERHLQGSGLNKNAVESAIKADVENSVKNASSTGEFWGKVNVDGRTITYRAYTLTDGSINVGTYTLPRP